MTGTGSATGSAKSAPVSPCDSCKGTAILKASNFMDGKGLNTGWFINTGGAGVVSSDCHSDPPNPSIACGIALPVDLPDFTGETVEVSCKCCPGCEWYWQAGPNPSYYKWINMVGNVLNQNDCSQPGCDSTCPEPTWQPSPPDESQPVAIGACGEIIDKPSTGTGT